MKQSSRQSEDVSHQFEQAVHAYRQGRLEQALTACEDILSKNTCHFDALHLAGVLCLRENRNAEALLYIEKALKIRPDNLALLSGLGLVSAKMGALTKALAAYDSALALRPDQVELLNSRGSVLMGLRRPEDAFASYKMAVTIRPDYLEALNNCGYVLQQLARSAEALPFFDRALALRPDHVEVLNNRGNALKDLRRNDEALAAYDEALALRPGDPVTHRNRGNALLALHRVEEALASYDKAIALNPNDAVTFNNRGISLVHLQRPEEGLSSYDKALGLDPDYAEAHNNRGAVLIELGQLNAACAAIERAIRLAPHTPRLYFNLCDCKRFTPGDLYLIAMEELARNIDAFSIGEQIYLHFGMAKAFDDTGDYMRAFKHMTAGNALKRSQITYRAVETHDILERTRAAFTSEVLRRNAGMGDPSPVPIFIVGMPRSGSTLVEQILASHPKVFGAGDVDDLNAAMMELGDALLDPVLPEALAQLPGDMLSRLGANYVARIRAAVPYAERITDKKLENFWLIGLIHMALPKARFIHTRRDPIDTCLSCFSKLFGDNNRLYSYELEELGGFYKAYEAMMAHWRNVLPSGIVIDVDYEDLVGDLEEQARRIIAHCNLGWDPRCLDFHMTKRPVRTASKAQVRQPLYKSSVGRSRVYEPFIAPLLKALGPRA